MKTIALLMPVHNGLEFTKKSISLLKEAIHVSPHSEYQVQLVVIEDGSTDGSGQWLRNNHPDVLIVEGDGSLWWSGSINAGMACSERLFEVDYYLLWNNDLIIKNNYFSNLFKIMDSVTRDIIICSKVFHADRPSVVFSMGGIFYPAFGIAYIISERHKRRFDLNKPQPVDWFGGMGTLIPREVTAVVGYFDEKQFPQYKGDLDFALRAGKKGFKSIAFPDLEIWNDTSQTGFQVNSLKTLFRSFVDQKSQYNFRENIRFYSRHAYPMTGLVGLFLRYCKLVFIYIINALE